MPKSESQQDSNPDAKVVSIRTSAMPPTRAAQLSTDALALAAAGLGPVRQERFAERVYENLFHAIVEGKISVGSRLPSENDLATLFDVSRPIVRQALDRLREDQLVESRRGSGTYVMDKPELAGKAANAEPSERIGHIMNGLELRMVIEPECAYMAALRRSTADLTRMDELLTGNLIVQLKSGRINLAVLFDDGQLSPFACTPMVEEEMMYITRADSQYGVKEGKGKSKSVTLAKAIKAPLILPGLQHGVRPRIENVVRAHGMSLENVIEINSVAILKSAILADIGATILPVAPLLSEIERGDMIAHPISGERMVRTLALCASKNIPLTNAAAAVERLVLDVTDDLCRKGKWLHAEALARE